MGHVDQAVPQLQPEPNAASMPDETARSARGVELIGTPFGWVHVDQDKGGTPGRALPQPEPKCLGAGHGRHRLSLWESTAMLQHAEDRVANESVYPRDLRTRADTKRWLNREGSHGFLSRCVVLVEDGVKPLPLGDRRADAPARLANAAGRRPPKPQALAGRGH